MLPIINDFGLVAFKFMKCYELSWIPLEYRCPNFYPIQISTRFNHKNIFLPFSLIQQREGHSGYRHDGGETHQKQNPGSHISSSHQLLNHSTTQPQFSHLENAVLNGTYLSAHLEAEMRKCRSHQILTKSSWYIISAQKCFLILLHCLIRKSAYYYITGMFSVILDSMRPFLARWPPPTDS